MYQHLNVAPPSVLSYRPELPALVGMVMEQVLAKDAGARFSTAGKLAAAFKRSITSSNPTASRATTTNEVARADVPETQQKGMGALPPDMFSQTNLPQPIPMSEGGARSTTSSPVYPVAPSPVQAAGTTTLKKLVLSPGTRRNDSRSVPQVWTPAGFFRMGTNTDKDARSDEQPEHVVTMTYGFWIDQYPVTNEAFQAFVDDGGYMKRQYWSNDGWRWVQNNGIKGPGNYQNFLQADQPRVGVSWYEADAYANWRGGRLPYEAEWEYAARGADARRFPGGAVFEDSNGNVKGRKTTAVNAYPEGVSWVGCLDMAGNVWEWCNDWYMETYYTREPITDPQGPSEGKGKALRGGSFRQDANWARCTSRRYDAPISRDDYIGFRVVLVPKMTGV